LLAFLRQIFNFDARALRKWHTRIRYIISISPILCRP
jgi:hypothetical protein